MENYDWMGHTLSLEAQVDMLRKEIEILSKSNFDKVRDFHSAFNMKVSEDPDLEIEDVALRLKLITEEYKEVVEAIESGRIVDIAKELSDILYVVYGTAVSFGIDIDAVFDEVHRSNMSKLGSDGRPIYRDDGKVLKGENYIPADVQKVLDEQG